MDKVLSYDQIIGFNTRIRSLRKGYSSNFFWDSKKHPYWIKNGKFHFTESEECVLLLHENKGFMNLFYISTDCRHAAESAERLSLNDCMVMDVVSRGEGLEEERLFGKAGFQKYRCLYRMNHVGKMDITDKNVSALAQKADMQDAGFINMIFESEFDPLSEQIPSISEIEDYIRRNQILIIKDNEQLSGFIIYEVIGATWYLRYWYTSPLYRNKGVGSSLLKSSLYDGMDTKRQILWVIDDNDNAIRRYEHYGFKREQFYNYVLVKNIEKYERKNH